MNGLHVSKQYFGWQKVSCRCKLLLLLIGSYYATLGNWCVALHLSMYLQSNRNDGWLYPLPIPIEIFSSKLGWKKGSTTYSHLWPYSLDMPEAFLVPRKRAASSFFTLYTMFSPDEKWVLMHIAAAGGEKNSLAANKTCMALEAGKMYGFSTKSAVRYWNIFYVFWGFFWVEKE